MKTFIIKVKLSHLGNNAYRNLKIDAISIEDALLIASEEGEIVSSILIEDIK